MRATLLRCLPLCHQKGVGVTIRQSAPAAEDHDEKFLCSLLPQLQSLTPRRKEVVKFKILQIIFQAQHSQSEEETQLHGNLETYIVFMFVWHLNIKI